jgi:sulfonate transport system permease protein
LSAAVADAATAARGTTAGGRGRTAARIWSATWPRLGAIAVAILAWQVVVLSGWRPPYVIPPPDEVFSRLFADMRTSEFYLAVFTTLRRAAVGFGVALVIGELLGLLVSRSRLLRTAIGSLISGLQSMPSVVWFPLAILLFNISEGAILFVVILGAAPSIANGVISGVDHIQPLILRAARMLGARGFFLYRRVLLPAALPAYLAGLKQGWAFAWRSLMAGELLVIIGSQSSLGVRLQFAREFSDAAGLVASMIVVLVVGIVVDSFVFGPLERGVRERRGLVDAAAA